MKSFFMSWVSVLSLLAASAVSANDIIPDCVSQGNILPVDNNNALNMESSNQVPNEYKTQAHVEGQITTIYPNQSGHQHFAIQLGDDPSQGIEVVYNMEFGRLPNLEVGMTVEACGEFIKADAPAGGYPASPMNAIIHWVHVNPSHSSNAHASGFLAIDGQLYGQSPSNGASGG